jgi:hypothetical protein
MTSQLGATEGLALPLLSNLFAPGMQKPPFLAQNIDPKRQTNLPLLACQRSSTDDFSAAVN